MVPSVLRSRLLGVMLVIAAGGAGIGTYVATRDAPSPAVLLAMEIGAYYESGGRHIGTPYVDKLGKGQPWTVCNGVTGPEVVPGKYYTPEDCERLELPKYRAAEASARRLFTYWDDYNVWVRASLIDMIYNLGETAVAGSTLLRKANGGDLIGACVEMPRFVYGTVGGRKVVLQGLVRRRATTAELCAEWGGRGISASRRCSHEGGCLGGPHDHGAGISGTPGKPHRHDTGRRAALRGRGRMRRRHPRVA